MAPQKRNSENQGLPARWKFQHGAYYYRVPKDLDHLWDGKRMFRLGATLAEAHRTWAARIDTRGRIHTIQQLADRYELEVLPGKAPKTRSEQARQLIRLRKVFGAVPLADGKDCLIEAHHAYTYFDARDAKTAAKRELELLSHMLTKAVEWGLIRANPLIGSFSVRGRMPHSESRYVEDGEILELLKVEPRRRKGSVRMLRAYVKLKLLTGLRMTDMLLLQESWIRADGIHIEPHKTRRHGTRAIIGPMDEILTAAIEECRAARPVDISPYLFCNRRGQSYFNETKGTANGFQSLWQRYMARALAETLLEQTFPERSLRRKAGSDAQTLEHAKALLAHTDSRTTSRWYRQKPAVVHYGRGVKTSTSEPKE